MKAYVAYGLLGWLIVINLIAFITCGKDKYAASHQRRRTPEKTLFLQALIGGSLGLYLGMYTFNHKTRHWYFVVGIPAIILIQAAIALWIHFLI